MRSTILFGKEGDGLLQLCSVVHAAETICSGDGEMTKKKRLARLGPHQCEPLLVCVLHPLRAAFCTRFLACHEKKWATRLKPSRDCAQPAAASCSPPDLHVLRTRLLFSSLCNRPTGRRNPASRSNKHLLPFTTPHDAQHPCSLAWL